MSDDNSRCNPDDPAAMPADEIVVNALRHSDESSMEAVAEHWWPELIRIVAPKIPPGAPFEADDIVASVFRTLIRGNVGNSERWQPKNGVELLRLLVTIANRKIAKKLRGNRLQTVEDLSSLAVEESVEELAIEALEEVRAKLQRQDLWQVFDLLVRQKTHQEIADELDVSTRTVSRQLDRVRERLETWSEQ